MKKINLILFISCFLTACVPLKSFFYGPNHIDKKGMRQGKWLYTSVQDPETVESKGTFKDDRPAGKWKYYDSEDNLIRKEKYRQKNGQTLIITTFYYPNRQVEKEGWATVEFTEIHTHYYWIGKWNYYNAAGELVAIKKFTKGLSEPEIIWESEPR